MNGAEYIAVILLGVLVTAAPIMCAILLYFILTTAITICAWLEVHSESMVRIYKACENIAQEIEESE